MFSDDLSAHLKAENEVLLSLERSDKCLFPIPEKFSDGSYLKIVEIDGEQHICRMLVFIDENFLDDAEDKEGEQRVQKDAAASSQIGFLTVTLPVV